MHRDEDMNSIHQGEEVESQYISVLGEDGELSEILVDEAIESSFDRGFDRSSSGRGERFSGVPGSHHSRMNIPSVPPVPLQSPSSSVPMGFPPMNRGVRGSSSMEIPSIQRPQSSGISRPMTTPPPKLPSSSQFNSQVPGSGYDRSSRERVSSTFPRTRKTRESESVQKEENVIQDIASALEQLDSEDAMLDNLFGGGGVKSEPEDLLAEDSLGTGGGEESSSEGALMDSQESSGFSGLEDESSVDSSVVSDVVSEVSSVDSSVVSDVVSGVSSVESSPVSEQGVGADSDVQVDSVVGEKVEIPERYKDAGFISKHGDYRDFSRKLTREQNWQELCLVMQIALDHSSWAHLPEVRSSLLKELARIHAEQLMDREAAERCYLQLLKEDPSDREAVSYLEESYRNRGDYRGLHDLYRSMVDSLWDQQERYEITKRAVSVALEDLEDGDLGVSDWEHLWSLGEQSAEVEASLMAIYRDLGRWASLAAFIQKRTEDWGGLSRLGLRELLEIYISGEKAAEAARGVLSQIRVERSSDPLLTMQEIALCALSRDVDRLAVLSRTTELKEEISRDIRRAAADALWEADERDLAIQAYDTLLAYDPNDREALRAKELYFSESGNYEALCQYYESRADEMLSKGGQGIEQVVQTLQKAADVAEKQLGDLTRAISLVKRIIEVSPEESSSYHRLIHLYEMTGNPEGVAQSLEGLLASSFRPAMRKEIFRKLGSLYFQELSRLEDAENCWQQVLLIDPFDSDVIEKLSKLYASRNDLESLDKSLTRQLRLSKGAESLDIAKRKAESLSEFLPLSDRSCAAWEVVLDYKADDSEALDAYSLCVESAEQYRLVVGALEHRLSCAESSEERGVILQRLVGILEEHGTRAEVLSVYERLLRIDPLNRKGLEGLMAYCREDESLIVLSAFEHAFILEQDVGERRYLLQQLLKYVQNDSSSRYGLEILERLALLGDEESLQRYHERCVEQGQSENVASLLTRLGYDFEDSGVRSSSRSRLSKMCVESLEDISRAYTVEQSSCFDCGLLSLKVEELESLAGKVNRWEELLGIYGVLSGYGFEVESRKGYIEKRIGVLLDRMSSGVRAVHEYRRLLNLCPSDESLLDRVEKLAEEQGLESMLISIYGGVRSWNLDVESRCRLTAKRSALLGGKLNSSQEALGELILRYRLKADEETEKALREEAERLNCWSLVLPLIEAYYREKACESGFGSEEVVESTGQGVLLSDEDMGSVAAEVSVVSKGLSVENFKEILVELGELYISKLDNLQAGLRLFAQVLISDSSNTGLFERFESCSRKAGEVEYFGQSLRLSASSALDAEHRMQLYKKFVKYLEEEKQDRGRCVDVYRRILWEFPKDIESLKFLISWHQEREEWAELRSELQRLSECIEDSEELCSLWMRIAGLCTAHLEDTEGALDAYARVLSIDEHHEEARQGIEGLTGTKISPEVMVRRLRLELHLASEEDRPRLMLSIAKVLDEDLKQLDAAREMLEQLLAETGASGASFKPLVSLLERQKDWPALIKLLVDRSEAFEDKADYDNATSMLQRALSVHEEHVKDNVGELFLLGKLRKLHPEDIGYFERYASRLRQDGRWEELADVLSESHLIRGIEDFRSGYRFELARVTWRGLGDKDKALKHYEELSRVGKSERNAFLGIATLLLDKGDIVGYVNALKRFAETLASEWASLLYCHLAEVCDEHEEVGTVADFYRRARELDANNSVASDSLRSIGRRLKNWRSTSSLLPVENERNLSWSERSTRLYELSQQAGLAPNEKRNWLWRSLCVNFDNVNAWEALGKLEKSEGRLELYLDACYGALGAFERSAELNSANTLKVAGYMFEAAQASLLLEDDKHFEILIKHAYVMAPNYAPVAIAIGDLHRERGEFETAYKVYDKIISHENVNLSSEVRYNLLFRRGLLALKSAHYEQAFDDLKATVRVNPLHAEALLALSKTYTALQQPLLSLYQMQRGLILIEDRTSRRGEILYQMGKIWSDNLEDSEEAGLYYESALNNNAHEGDLIERCLEIYRKAGRYTEALELVERLVSATTESDVLAGLWCTRGELLEGSSAEQAAEAYDMALSYVPGLVRALDGLERVLAKEEEWEQLADLLEGRLEGEETSSKSAPILMRLADLFMEKLDKKQRAHEMLQKLMEISPSAGVVERLLQSLGDDENSQRERISLLEKGVYYCDDRYDKALQLAMHYLSKGERLHAWAIMTPLRVLFHMDNDLKEIFNQLKSDFDRMELDLGEKVRLLLVPLSEAEESFVEVVHRVEKESSYFGVMGIENVAEGAVEVTEFTPNGKLFHQLRGNFGMGDVQLWRAVDIDESVVVSNGEKGQVCLKTEIFQKASGNELQYWLAKALMMSHPRYRALYSLPKSQRGLFMKGVLDALGVGSYPEAEVIAKRVREGLEDSSIAEMGKKLRVHADKLNAMASEYAQSCDVAVNVIAAAVIADLRTVWRALSREDDSLPEQRNVKKIEEIQEIFKSSLYMARSLAYYVSEEYGKLLR